MPPHGKIKNHKYTLKIRIADSTTIMSSHTYACWVTRTRTQHTHTRVGSHDPVPNSQIRVLGPRLPGLYKGPGVPGYGQVFPTSEKSKPCFWIPRMETTPDGKGTHVAPQESQNFDTISKIYDYAPIQ